MVSWGWRTVAGRMGVVVSNALVSNHGMETVLVGVVVNLLNATVRQVHEVTAFSPVAVASLSVAEAGAAVVVLYSVVVGVLSWHLFQETVK